jgi:hypothetical protein
MAVTPKLDTSAAHKHAEGITNRLMSETNTAGRFWLLILIANAQVVATFVLTVCIRAHPVWCAFFG